MNRFLVQAVVAMPLTVYGKGGQTPRIFEHSRHVAMHMLAAVNPAAKGELRIFNQFTETFSVLDLAKRIQQVAASMGLQVRIDNIANPRKEKEEHYYKPSPFGSNGPWIETTPNDR